jgi:hypothetical protein
MWLQDRFYHQGTKDTKEADFFLLLVVSLWFVFFLTPAGAGKDAAVFRGHRRR